jgi:hypothetical protein
MLRDSCVRLYDKPVRRNSQKNQPRQGGGAACLPEKMYRICMNRVNSSAAVFLVAETIAHVAHCIDEAVFGILYLAAQAPYMNVHGAVPAEVVVAPNVVEERIARVHATGVAGKKA